MNNDQLKADNAQYLWHPMAHPGAMKKSTPDIIAKGEGCWIWDVDGHKMLDGVGGLWACNLGHSNRPVIDAIVAQMKADEMRHAQEAQSAGAVELPAPIKGLMQVAAKVMTTVAHRI